MQVLNPLQTAMAGYQAGFGQFQQLDEVRRQREADRMAAELHDAKMAEYERATAAAQAAQQLQADFYTSISDGTMTGDKAREFLANPYISENLADAAQQYLSDKTDEQLRADFGVSSRIFSAALSDPEQAAALLDQNIEAAQASGNTERAEVFQGIKAALSADPTAAASMAYQASAMYGSRLGDEGEVLMKGLDNVWSAYRGADPTTLQRDAVNYADLQGFERGSPQHRSAQREYIDAKKDSPGVQITLAEGGPSKDTLSPMQLKMDDAYTNMLVDWNITGGADVVKSLDQLNDVADRIEGGEENLSGWIIGNTPDLLLGIVNPSALDAQELVAEIVQRNLKAVLGAQFTEKEGQALIARAYNPSLPEEYNARRLRRLIQSIDTRARALESLNQHFDTYGTSQGWSGQLPSIQQMLEENEAADRAGAGPREGQTIKQWNRATQRFESTQVEGNE
jgi:hypothetical protein